MLEVCTLSFLKFYFLSRLESFSSAAARMLVGENSPAVQENRIFGVQALSGTGALRFKLILNYFKIKLKMYS